MQSERQEPATRDQLHGLLRRAKMKVRMGEDQKAQRKFRNVPPQVVKMDVHPHKQILIS